MEYLFNSKGKHIANFVNGHLYAPTGNNVGHYIESGGIFINMNGRYLGEIVQKNRLMYKRTSPYKSTNYGNRGSYGSVGNYGSPGSRGSIGTLSGYIDIETPWIS